MSEPPGDDNPKIVEPPFDPETDTRPLKPLRRPEGQGPEKVVMPRVRRRPATILQEASSSPLPALSKPAPPSSDDTDRVRLVPKQPEPPPWRLILTTSGSKASTIGLDVREAL